MNTKLTIATALFAGILGGVITRYVTPPVAFAQDQPQLTKEVRAQSLTLVDPADRTIGTFSAEPLPGGVTTSRPYRPNFQSKDQGSLPVNTGPMRIVLRDANGTEIWSAPGGVRMLPATTQSSR